MTSGIWNLRVLSQKKQCRHILSFVFSTECGTFSVRSPVIFCYVILPLSHISVPCSTLRNLYGTYAVDALCAQQHSSLTADNTEPSSYTLKSIVDCQIQPRTPRKASCMSQVPLRAVSGTKRDC